MGQFLTVTDVLTACVVVIFDSADNSTSVQVVETLVTVNNSPIQDCAHPDDHAQPTHVQYRLAHFITPPHPPLLHPCLLSQPYLLHYLLFHFSAKKKPRLQSTGTLFVEK